jgi:hypothetical protein
LPVGDGDELLCKTREFRLFPLLRRQLGGATCMYLAFQLFEIAHPVQPFDEQD